MRIYRMQSVNIALNHYSTNSSVMSIVGSVYVDTTYYVQKQSSRGVLWKKMFVEISQNSWENTCARVSFLIKLQTLGLKLYLKRDSGIGVFPWIFEISKNIFFYRTPLVAASVFCPSVFMLSVNIALVNIAVYS